MKDGNFKLILATKALRCLTQSRVIKYKGR